MDYIAPLKTFDREDLLHILQACAHNLVLAYQETEVQVLFYTAEIARDACNYLMYELYKEMPQALTH